MATKTAMQVLSGDYEPGDHMMSMTEAESRLPEINLSIRVETAENAYVVRLCDYGDEDEEYRGKERVLAVATPTQAGMVIMRALGKGMMKKGMSNA
jgi:hypothetical protein